MNDQSWVCAIAGHWWSKWVAVRWFERDPYPMSAYRSCTRCSEMELQK